jgi:hypothetical protein
MRTSFCCFSQPLSAPTPSVADLRINKHLRLHIFNKDSFITPQSVGERQLWEILGSHGGENIDGRLLGC